MSNFNMNTYHTDPWGRITQNERPWYDQLLREMYMRQAVYSPFIPMQIDLTARQARTFYFSDIIPPRPYVGALPPRETRASRVQSDSFQRELTVERQGNGFSIHRESQMFNYWQRDGSFDLRLIIEQAMGQMIIDHLDTLARNALLSNPYNLFGSASATGFADIGTSSTNLLNTNIVDAVKLQMQMRQPMWRGLPIDPGRSDIVCITSFGALYDLMREYSSATPLTFVGVNQYAPTVNLFTGEIGSYRGVRFIGTNMATLWNCGAIIQQKNITAQVKPGDGAPDPNTTKVDGVFKVGQPEATHYIQLNNVTGLNVGDVVTIHKVRHTSDNTRGVLNGVDYTDPMLQNVEIVSIDTANNRIVINQPYLMTNLDGTGLETDLGGGVYGYVTKGRNIHTAIFMKTDQLGGVMAGVAQPPNIYMPPPIDDYMSVYRFTYDFWLKYALWDPTLFTVVFVSGSTALRTMPVIQ